MTHHRTRERSVSIVGAGIVGLCCGLTLLSEGYDVTIVDPKAPGSATSFGNAGIIADDMIIPISTPGLWAKLPWMLLSPMSPMKLRWSYLPKAIPWLYRFLAAGRSANTRAVADDLYKLHSIASASHAQLMSQYRIDTNLVRHNGVLQLHRRPETHPDQLTREILDSHDIRLETLSADEIYQLEPGLNKDFDAATFFPEMGSVVQPFALASAYAEAFLASGGRFIREEVRSFTFVDSRVHQLVTDLGIHPVDNLVIAAGAWSRRLVQLLHSDVPLDTERGYHLNVEWTDKVILNRPVFDSDRYAYFLPMSDGVRITSGSEIGGLELGPDFRRIYRVLASARSTVKNLDGDVTREWMGYRPSMPDSKPVIDRSMHFSNAYYAFGHGHCGLTQAAATGALISDLVVQRPPRIDIKGFSASRF